MRTFIILISTTCIISLSSCGAGAVSIPTNVTIIKTASKHYKIVTVKGKRYFFWNGNHYRKTRKGFVIVRV